MAGSNGRAFDAEIADVVLQAILDGHHSYRQAVAVVNAQAGPRAAAVKKARGTRVQVEAERRRWANFGPCSITRWKKDNADFERDLMLAEDLAADEQIEDVRKLAREVVELADDDALDWRERQTRLQGRRHLLAVEMWAIKTRLDRRKTWHESTPQTGVVIWPTLPPNPRFDRVSTPGREDERPN